MARDSAFLICHQLKLMLPEHSPCLSHKSLDCPAWGEPGRGAGRGKGLYMWGSCPGLGAEGQEKSDSFQGQLICSLQSSLSPPLSHYQLSDSWMQTLTFTQLRPGNNKAGETRGLHPHATEYFQRDDLTMRTPIKHKNIKLS